MEKKRETYKDIDKKRKAYFIAEVEKLKGRSHIPFKALNRVTNPDSSTAWQVGNLRPELSHAEVAEELATFFSRIADKFVPLDFARLPTTFRDEFPPVSPEEIASRIRSLKKPLSAVTGDSLLCVMNAIANLLAIPTCRTIINHSFAIFTWPRPWLIEKQTPVPKTASLESFDDIQNILCTNHFSKNRVFCAGKVA